MASAGGGAMQTLQSHIEDMRSLTNCKICLKPFYEPYILACGHTYCYSCLRSWFLGRTADGLRYNKNCPDCRASVIFQPAPNYAMRDLTHMFVQRVELIAEDETVQEHVKDMAEEADVLNKDKAGLGLFRGIFSVPPTMQLDAWTRPRLIYDEEDENIARCPICTHEVVDGACTNCDFDLNDGRSFDLSVFDESDDDDDDDNDSDEDSINSTIGSERRRPPRAFNIPEADSDEDDDDSEADQSEADQYDEHDDFIDNEIEDDVDDMDNASDTRDSYGDLASQSSYGTTIHDDLYSFDRSIDVNSNMAIHRNLDVESSTDVATNYDESEDDDDDDDDIVEHSRAPARRVIKAQRRRPIVVSDDEDEEEEEEEREVEQEVYHNANETTMTSEGESETSQGSSEISPETSDQDEEESDDTAIPPQSGHSRHERLVNHRARRPDKNTPRVGRNSVELAGRSQPNRSSHARSYRDSGRRIGTTTRVY